METAVILLLCAAGLGALGWFLWRTSRSTGSDNPFEVPSWLRPAAGRAWRSLVKTARAAYLGWVAWRDRPRGPGPVVPGTEAPVAPAPRRPAPAALAAQIIDDAIPAGATMQLGPVPPEWAALAARVGSFEPENDEDYLAHIRGEMAGFAAYSESVRAGADVLASETGLDPAVVHAHLEMADATGDCAHDVAMVGRRFSVIYAAVQESVAAGVRLPFRAREFLTGAGG